MSEFANRFYQEETHFAAADPEDGDNGSINMEDPEEGSHDVDAENFEIDGNYGIDLDTTIISNDKGSEN